ncbi:MAG: TonB-dependent receptor [Endomicrobium sp.]|nr:TonB-dependent receptor [Endomicrobium sp.]
MKKPFAIAVCLCMVSSFVPNYVLAEEVFLTLTKYDSKTEELPTNISIITQEEIERKHVETLGQLLAQETSIFYGNYGMGINSSFVFMRGAASSARVLLLIDGRRVYTLDSNMANFASIPASNIAKVEIIRGSGAAVYGTGAFGGVINVITKKADVKTPLASAGISYGSFNSYSGNITGAYYQEDFSALLSGSGFATDGYRKNSEYGGYNAFFSGQYNINENNKLFLTGNYWRNKFGLAGPQTKTILPSLTAEDENVSYYAKLDYDLSFNDGDFLQISAYASHDTYHNKGDRKLEYYYKNFSDIYGFQADFHYKDILLAGAEFWQEKYTNNNFNISWYPPYDTAYSEYDITQENYAAYMQLNYVVGKLRLIPGIRGNHNSKYGDVFTPSLAAVFNVNENLNISGNTGRVWRAPTFVDLYYPGWSNPDLKPEQGVSSDLGVEYINNKFRVSATGYYILTNDLIVSLQNVGKTRQYGLEFEAGYIFNAKFQNKINYTYLNAKDTANTENETTLLYSPQHSINYTVSCKLMEKLNFTVTASYKSEYIGNKADFSGKLDMDGFFTTDLSVNYNLNDKFNFWIKGFNLTNADYAIIDGYKMPGTTVYTGVDFKFWK